MKNIYQIIHIIGSIQGLFLFILLVMRKENKLANKILAFLLFMITLHLATAFFHTNNDRINDLLAIGRSDMFIFFYGPLIAFYTLFLTGFRQKPRPGHFFHLTPAIVLLLLVLSSIFGTDTSPFQLWEENNPYLLRLWYVIHLSALIHLFSYLIYGVIVVYKYKKQLSSYFSNSGKVRLLWLELLLSGMMFISFFAILQFFINLFHDPEGILQWIISLSIVLLVFIMGYFTNKQPDILDDLKDMNQFLASADDTDVHRQEREAYESTGQEDKKAKYERNRLDEAEERSNLDKLLKYVEGNKPYLEAELNLKQLSEEVGIPAHQLSMLLSIYLQQNFYTFINKYRIEEAKMRLGAKDSRDHNILTIAFETGFNSKSTFNAVFKKFVGITPSEYRTMSLDEKQLENQKNLV